MSYESLKSYLKEHGARRFRIISGNLQSTCPFPDHPDRKPSFGVKVDRNGNGVYQCYGCQRTGSIWGLIKELDPGIPNVRGLIEEFANDSPIYKLEDAGSEQVYRMREEDYERFAILHDYWFSRGVNMDSIKKFLLGYCPERWSVTFPVRSFVDQSLIGVCFRVIDTHPSFPHELKLKMDAGYIQKYNYLQNTKASFSLFGVEYIKNDEEVYLFEGPIDAINFMQRNPDKQALAKWGGQSLNRRQAEYLKRFRRVYIVADNDKNGSGQRIAINTKNLLVQNRILCQIFILESGVKDYTEAVMSNKSLNLVPLVMSEVM